MSESDAAPASEPSAPAEPAEDPNEVVRFLTHLSPTYAEPAKVCRRGECGVNRLVVGSERDKMWMARDLV